MHIMKALILSLAVFSCALGARAAERGELDSEIRIFGAKLDALQAQPAKRIPADILDRAQGIILLERAKAGRLSPYDGGGGVAMVKNPVSGAWSPVAFVGANAARLGIQPGAPQSFFVILLMDTNATRLLIDPTYEFDARTPGSGVTATQAGGGIVSTKQTILVFDDQLGFLGATAAQSGAFVAIDAANRVYYGPNVTPRDILFDRQVAPTAATAELASKVAGHSITQHS